MKYHIVGICSQGKIDNIINNIFNGNIYTSYYIFKRLGDNIEFDGEYDKKIYDRVAQRTSNALNRIILPLQKLEISKKVEPTTKDIHK